MNQPAATIVVRHAEPGDADAIWRIFSAPQAIAGTLQLPFPSLERTRKRVADLPDGVYRLVACADDDVVGSLGLSIPANPRRRHVGQIGMAVRDDWQGKGVGTALITAALDLADNWLNLRRVELEVYTDNAAGIALYRKFGFRIEGTHRAFAFRNGQYIDAHAMARVRAEPSV